MTRYSTDQEYGAQPRTIDVVDERVRNGLRSLIATGLHDGSFGYRFPAECPDGGAAFGCNWQAFGHMLHAEVRDIDWPLPEQLLPPTDVILDLLVFCASAVGQPIKESYHPYFRHDHLSWNREAGLERFLSDVNRIFARTASLTSSRPMGRGGSCRSRWRKRFDQWSSRPATTRPTDCLTPPATESRHLRKMIAGMLLRSSGTRSSGLRRWSPVQTNDVRRTHCLIGPQSEGRNSGRCWVTKL